MEGFLLAGGFANCLLNKLSEGFTPLLPDAGGVVKSAFVAQSRLHFCDCRPPLAPPQLLIPPSLPSYTEPFYVIFYCPEDVSSRRLRKVCKMSIRLQGVTSQKTFFSVPLCPQVWHIPCHFPGWRKSSPDARKLDAAACTTARNQCHLLLVNWYSPWKYGNDSILWLVLYWTWVCEWVAKIIYETFLLPPSGNTECCAVCLAGRRYPWGSPIWGTC